MRGIIQGLIGLGIGALVFFFWHRAVSYVVLAVSSLVLLAALASPGGAYRTISVLIDKLAYSLGMVATWVLLVPVFYLFFTPFRLVSRGRANDRMVRTLDRSAGTYWNTRESVPDIDSYERQF